MGKRGEKKIKPMVGDVTNALGLGRLLLGYLEWMGMHNYAESSVKDREFHLRSLIHWLDERDITKAGEVTRPILERYQRHLYHYRKPSGKPLSFIHQNTKLVPIRAFFKWLSRQNYIPYNPASELLLLSVEFCVQMETKGTKI